MTRLLYGATVASRLAYGAAVVAAALLCACSRTSTTSSTPPWRKQNPPLWTYVARSQPGSGDHGRRFFINTKVSLDPPNEVEVLLRSQQVSAGEAEDADVPKDDENTTVIRYGCNEQSQTYHLAPRLLAFSGRDWPNEVPPTPKAITYQQYVDGLKPIERGTIDEEARAAACFFAGSRLREINDRMHAVSSAADDQQRGVALRDVVIASGLSCDSVDSLLDRGADNEGNRFWGVACRNGEKYNVDMKSGGHGYSVISCSEYHSLSNGDCFKKLFQ
jgi:hypothetical protein